METSVLSKSASTKSQMLLLETPARHVSFWLRPVDRAAGPFLRIAHKEKDVGVVSISEKGAISLALE